MFDGANLSALCIGVEAAIIAGILVFVIGTIIEIKQLKKGAKHKSGSTLSIALLIACSVCCIAPWIYVGLVGESRVPPECPLPPEGFSESDLIGTWGGTIDEAWDSTIIIREDNHYKQIVNVSWQKFRYEGDWKPWRVTYSDKGLPHLHLEGFLMCAYWRQIDCRTGNTGFTPVVIGDTKDIFADITYWYDGCQKEWVDTPGEGIFMVFGASEFYQRQIRLVPFQKAPGTSTGPSYELRKLLTQKSFQ